MLNKFYSKNPLSEIVSELNFDNPIDITEKIPLFHEKIKKYFPYYDIQTNPKIDINITNQDGKIKTTQEPDIWQFHEEKNIYDSLIIIKLTKNYCILDFSINNNYNGFQKFKKQYIQLLINALSVFNIKEYYC